MFELQHQTARSGSINKCVSYATRAGGGAVVARTRMCARTIITCFALQVVYALLAIITQIRDLANSHFPIGGYVNIGSVLTIVPLGTYIYVCEPGIYAYRVVSSCFQRRDPYSMFPFFPFSLFTFLCFLKGGFIAPIMGLLMLL